MIKGTPKGVSILCMTFLLLENLMSGDVEDRNARAMTSFYCINYFIIFNHIFQLVEIK